VPLSSQVVARRTPQRMHTMAPAGQSVSQSASQSVRRSVNQSINQSISQSASQSVSQSISRSVSQSVSQSVGQSVGQSVSQSINQSIIQSINQSIDQSINRASKQTIKHTAGTELAEGGPRRGSDGRRRVVSTARAPGRGGDSFVGLRGATLAAAAEQRVLAAGTGEVVKYSGAQG